MCVFSGFLHKVIIIDFFQIPVASPPHQQFIINVILSAAESLAGERFSGVEGLLFACTATED